MCSVTICPVFGGASPDFKKDPFDKNCSNLLGFLVAKFGVFKLKSRKIILNRQRRMKAPSDFKTQHTVTSYPYSSTNRPEISYIRTWCFSIHARYVCCVFLSLRATTNFRALGQNIFCSSPWKKYKT